MVNIACSGAEVHKEVIHKIQDLVGWRSFLDGVILLAG